MIDQETFKKAMGRVFDIPWDAESNDWVTTHRIATCFRNEELETAEMVAELSDQAITELKAQHNWTIVMTHRMRKLLGWMQESRRTTAAWADVQKEMITTRQLAVTLAGSPTAAHNRSFGDLTAGSNDESNKTRDIKLDLKTMVELKNDRKFNSWYRAFKNRMTSERLGYFWDDESTIPTVDDPAFAEYKYHCSKILAALEYLCKTPQSQLIIRKHMDSSAARACLAELESTFMDGMTRKLDLRAADEEWRNYQLAPSYNKSLVAWLTGWSQKEANYNDYAEDDELIKDHTKRQMLERAISQHEAFKTAIKVVLLEESRTKKPMEYPDFWNLIYDYALQEDTQNSLSTSQEKRQANQAISNGQNSQSNHGGGSNHHGRGSGGGRGGNQQGRGGSGRGRGGHGYVHTYAETQTIDLPENLSYISSDVWLLLTRDQQQEVFRRRGTSQDATQQRVSAPAEAPTAQTAFHAAASTATSSTDSVATTASAATARVTNTSRGSALRNFLGDDQTTAAPTQARRGACIAEQRRYKVSVSDMDAHLASTVDRGASGGVWGADGRILSEDKSHKIEVSGVGGLKLLDLPLVTAAAKLKSNKGWVVGVFPNFAHAGVGKTIHSSLQMEAFGLLVSDKHRAFGGGLRIETPDGYEFTLGMECGMATLPMFPVSDDDLETLPRVLMTSDGVWDPSMYDVKAFDEDIQPAAELGEPLLAEEEDDYDDLPPLMARGDDDYDSDDEDDESVISERIVPALVPPVSKEGEPRLCKEPVVRGKFVIFKISGAKEDVDSFKTGDDDKDDHGLGNGEAQPCVKPAPNIDPFYKELAKSYTGKEPRYKFGVQVPRDWIEARRLQEAAGHTKWTDAESIELANMDNEPPETLGEKAKPLPDYKRFVYDVKQNLRYKARLVEGGHLIQHVDDVYFSIGSLEVKCMGLVMEGPTAKGLADALQKEGWQLLDYDPEHWSKEAGDCYCVCLEDLLSIEDGASTSDVPEGSNNLSYGEVKNHEP